MQPNNSVTDLNIRSVLVCYVYARLKRWVFNLDLKLTECLPPKHCEVDCSRVWALNRKKDLRPAVDLLF